MLSITSILSMFSLLVICTFIFFLSKKTKYPYTVLLVFVGLLLVPLTKIWPLNQFSGFLTEFSLTPELLFYIFLPTLIFESAFNMNIRKIVDNVWSISFLSIFGLLISAFLISGILYFILPLLGLNIPFIVLLLFASIISATDPVAVLALFKEYNAPKRLSLIFEGESLFNDGTAVAMFLVVLAIAQKGFHGVSTILGGLATFTSMIVLGILFGLFVALIFSFFLRLMKSNEFVSITLLIVSAHIIFILSELINHNGLFGIGIHISPIIATTFGALFLGNYTRHTLSPKSDEYIEKSVGHLAFIINSLVFILVGILFASTNIEISSLLFPIIITIFIVAIARAVSVYLTIYPLNKIKVEENIPTSWQHLLSWGSLRGALAIIIVLMIPNDFSVTGWQYSFTPKEFLIALSSGCILATLFIKATTIKKIMDYLKVKDEDIFQDIAKVNFTLMSLYNKKKKLREFVERGFINLQNAHEEETELEKIRHEILACKKDQDKLLEKYGEKFFVHELHLRAINIEEKYLKELYINNEITEKVYRRIKNKLNIQREKIENLEIENFNSSVYTDRKDIFEKFMNTLLSPFDKKRNFLSISEQLEYYRAQAIISRKVVKNLNLVNELFSEKIFPAKIFSSVVDIYENHKNKNNEKFLAYLEIHKDVCLGYVYNLNKDSLKAASLKALHYLEGKGVISEADIANFEI